MFNHLSTNTQNAMQRAGVVTIEQLAECSAQDLLKLRGVGRVACFELAALLVEQGRPELFDHFKARSLVHRETRDGYQSWSKRYGETHRLRVRMAELERDAAALMRTFDAFAGLLIGYPEKVNAYDPHSLPEILTRRLKS